MRIILNDSCCLIDLRKVGLLRKMLDLPYRMAVVYPVRKFELLSIPEPEWSVLEAAGLEIIDLSGELIREAEQAKRHVRGPSIYDCFGFVQARALGRESILLTNDRQLRQLAVLHQVAVHGTLWLLDEFLCHGVLGTAEYIAVLQDWDADETVRLPKDEVQKRLEKR
ncbi:MAG: PIN domain-containing protein [Oscillochloris sp.]|nr:PIN domain-containing protein [Oscillochloris sp.]